MIFNFLDPSDSFEYIDKSFTFTVNVCCQMFKVGPKQRDYKVKDRREYEFKPEQIVSDIAHIYVYLGRDENFCKAVLGESRSFSHNLLPQAMTVLTKIGVSQDFITKFEELSAKLKVPLLTKYHVIYVNNISSFYDLILCSILEWNFMISSRRCETF